jgi:hypothetical protein
LENLCDNEDINRAWENIKENIKNLHQNEECVRFLDQRKQAKMQWFQDRNQSHVDYLNNVRSELCRLFRNKKEVKIYELETNNKIKNITGSYRGMSDLKNGYLLRNNTVRDEKGDLVAGCHSILARWRKHFFQLFNVHGVSYIRQTEIHTAEPLVPEPSAFEI